jgi:hypothetical protein
MKKITICLMATCVSLSLFSAPSNAATTSASTPVTISKPIESPEANALVLRLNEIKTMDKSALSSSQKKALRKEVHAIDKNLHDNYGGVYISVGGLIIILILLIILL